MSCSITTGVLESPGLLSSCFMITFALQNTIILITQPIKFSTYPNPTQIPNTVAFTDVEVVLQGVQEGSEAEFHALSPSSTIIALSTEDAGGREHAFQLTAAKSIIQMCANSQEEVDTWIQWMQEIIPVPITVDAQEILFRAALKKVNDEEYYEVIIEEKKALGVVFQPGKYIIHS